MERGYWFKSDLFHIHKGEDVETNPGCYGKDLGEWLCKKFKEKMRNNLINLNSLHFASLGKL